jgi:hypothetical protein
MWFVWILSLIIEWIWAAFHLKVPEENQDDFSGNEPDEEADNEVCSKYTCRHTLSP